MNYDGDTPVEVQAPESTSPLPEETSLPKKEAFVITELQPPPVAEEESNTTPQKSELPPKENDTTTPADTASHFLKLSDLLSDDTDLVSDEQFTFLKPDNETAEHEVSHHFAKIICQNIVWVIKPPLEGGEGFSVFMDVFLASADLSIFLPKWI